MSGYWQQGSIGKGLVYGAAKSGSMKSFGAQKKPDQIRFLILFTEIYSASVRM